MSETYLSRSLYKEAFTYYSKLFSHAAGNTKIQITYAELNNFLWASNLNRTLFESIQQIDNSINIISYEEPKKVYDLMIKVTKSAKLFKLSLKYAKMKFEFEEDKSNITYFNYYYETSGMFFDLFQYKEAENSLEESFKYIDSDNELLAKYEIRKGNIEYHTKKYKEAKASYEKAKSIIDDKRVLTPSSMAVLLNNLSLVELKLGNKEKALDHLTNSNQLLIKYGLKLYPKNYSVLANIYLENNELDSAFKYIKMFEDFVEKEGDLNEISNSENLFYLYYSKQNDLDNALASLEKYMQSKDSLIDQESQNRFKRMELEFKSEMKTRENKLIQESKRNQLYLFLFIFFLLIMIAILFYLRLREKSRTNRLIKQQNDDLKKLNNEIQQQRDQLEKINNTKDKILSILSHDLRNPLQGFILITEILIKHKSSLDANTVNRYYEDIQSTAVSASKLIDNLSLWAKTKDGAIQQNVVTFNVKQQIDDILVLSHLNAIQKKISIVNTVSSLDVTLDSKIFDTVVRNLIGNSLKFTPETGTISISSEIQNDLLKISIQDTGIGIDDEKLKEIKSGRSVKSTPGTNNEKGTGLGLAFCIDFLSIVGSELIIESEVGKGSRFSFEIPLSNEKGETN